MNILVAAVRFICVMLLLAPMATITPPARGHDAAAKLSGTADRFFDAERRIKSVDDDAYWRAREELAKQALHLAETDLASKDSEKLLHWILHAPRTTPTVLKAAKRLAEQHPTSDFTLNELMGYAQHPRQ